MTTWLIFFLIVSVIVLSIPFLRGSAGTMDGPGPDGDGHDGPGSEPY
ncbi:MAG: hypothetical protein GXP52_09835 [Deltaproteobacteria bacterium]|nr:hypothetical protein [Deltaproteobacteria bacterium]